MTPTEWRQRIEAAEKAAASHCIGEPGELTVLIYGDPEAGRGSEPDEEPPFRSTTQPSPEEYRAYQERERERVRLAAERPPTRMVIKVSRDVERDG
jgi:hypothetical protein